MVFWLVSLPPTGGRKDRTWETLQERCSAQGTALSKNYKFEIPDLRIGTLDSLLALSDELQKISNSMEATCAKIRRTVADMSGPSGLGHLRVDNLSPEDYLVRFKWDEPKYPSRRPLKETVEKIMEIVGHLEDDLKIKLSEYNTLKSQLSAAARKATGSLAVRDIGTMVKPNEVVDSENLTTLFVIVSKFGMQEWTSTYETMSQFVVPRSSKLLCEDNDYALVTVVLFKRVMDDFKVAARSKGYQVREYTASVAEGESASNASEALRADVESRRSALEAWCRTAYGEAYSCWVHIAAVRLFVESILRYGLPPAFQSVVMRPADKQETKLRAVLAESFGGNNQFWTDDGAPVAGVAAEAELYPYVSFTVNADI